MKMKGQRRKEGDGGREGMAVQRGWCWWRIGKGGLEVCDNARFLSGIRNSSMG